MRRWATWLLVGALVVLGSVAVADALRGSPRTAESRPPAISVALIPRNEPASSAISGVLYYSDENDGCRLAGIGFPDLRSSPAPALESCRFSLSPAGRDGLAGEAEWSPLGGIYAREAGGLIELGSPASHQSLHFPGRAPAFKPDGTFTYVRGNDVVEWTTSCPRGTRLFTLPGDNATARCRETVARFGDWPVLELEWLSNSRMAIITQPSEYVLLIREAGRTLVSFPGFGGPVTDLRVSPRRRLLSVQAHGRGGLIVFHANGGIVPLPPFTHARSIAWSPDERWTAVATRYSVFIFRTDEGEARVRRLPIVARDLAWR